MRLVDLNPWWFGALGIDTGKDGMTFLCPCAKCLANPDTQVRLAVQFANPVGAEPKPAMTFKEKRRHVHDLRTFDVPPGFLWTRLGETFEAITITPSVDASKAGHWHGFITAGEVR
jgi:hypothetical protein